MQGASNQTDEELVRSATFGDLLAFDELVRRFRYAVTMVAYDILGSRDLAEDVVQDTFLTAYKALPQLSDPTKFPSWLHAIARNRSRRVGGAEAAHRAVPLSAVDGIIVGHSAELGEGSLSHVEDRIEAARIQAEIAKMPEEQSQTLQLYHGQEWSVAQIATFFSVPQTTVKWRLHEGRRALRKRLADLASR